MPSPGELWYDTRDKVSAGPPAKLVVVLAVGLDDIVTWAPVPAGTALITNPLLPVGPSFQRCDCSSLSSPPSFDLRGTFGGQLDQIGTAGYPLVELSTPQDSPRANFRASLAGNHQLVPTFLPATIPTINHAQLDQDELCALLRCALSAGTLRATSLGAAGQFGRVNYFFSGSPCNGCPKRP